MPGKSHLARSGTRLAQQGRVATVHERDFRARAFQLAVEVFRLHPKLAAAGPGHALIARQLLRSAAAIGAQLEEGAASSSRRDMAAKYGIALREAREAHYWARLAATDPRWAADLAPVIQETREFVAMLTAAVKKLRQPAGR
jgi:four helix bundle protein